MDVERYGSPSRAPRKQRNLPLPLFRARVETLADSSHVLHSDAARDASIIDKINKLFERANHSSTDSTDRAFEIAQQLMKQYNITQDELRVRAGARASQADDYGASLVALRRLDENESKPVYRQNWVPVLAGAIKIYFNCDVMSRKQRTSLVLEFFGVTVNTAGAAVAFEWVYNLTVERARKFVGTSARNSYAQGVCKELVRKAWAKRSQDVKTAQDDVAAVAARDAEEEALRQAQLARLQDPNLDEHDESSLLTHLLDGNGDDNNEDDEDDEYQDEEEDGSNDEDVWLGFEDNGDDSSSDVGWNGFDGNVEEEIRYSFGGPIARQDSPKDVLSSGGINKLPITAVDERDAGSNLGASEVINAVGSAASATVDDMKPNAYNQLVRIRDYQKQAAQNYLKARDIKLSKYKKPKAGKMVREAYDIGLIDGRSLNLSQKPIEWKESEDGTP